MMAVRTLPRHWTKATLGVALFSGLLAGSTFLPAAAAQETRRPAAAAAPRPAVRARPQIARTQVA